MQECCNAAARHAGFTRDLLDQGQTLLLLKYVSAKCTRRCLPVAADLLPALLHNAACSCAADVCNKGCLLERVETDNP